MGCRVWRDGVVVIQWVGEMGYGGPPGMEGME